MSSTGFSIQEPKYFYEVTDPDGWSQNLWLLSSSSKVNRVHVYEGVIVPVLWSRKDEDPIVSAEILTRKIAVEDVDANQAYDHFLGDAQDNGKDIGMVVARLANEELLEMLTEYIKGHLYEMYEQFLFRPWISRCVDRVSQLVANEHNGIIATMQVPGFGTIPGVSQKRETNVDGVLVYTTP